MYLIYNKMLKLYFTLNARVRIEFSLCNININVIDYLVEHNIMDVEDIRLYFYCFFLLEINVM